MKRRSTLLLALLIVLGLFAVSQIYSTGILVADDNKAAPEQEKKADTPPVKEDKQAGEVRPAEWAKPLPGKPGLENLHQITPNLYRGAQPTAEGFKELKKMGIKTIINLRAVHSDRDEMKEAGVEFQYHHISFKAWHPEDEDVVKFLKIIDDKNNYPIFFHCQHGADRTGMMAAIYRMVIQGWKNDAAVREMIDGGYNFHQIWSKIRKYVETFDRKKFENLVTKAS